MADPVEVKIVPDTSSIKNFGDKLKNAFGGVKTPNVPTGGAADLGSAAAKGVGGGANAAKGAAKAAGAMSKGLGVALKSLGIASGIGLIVGLITGFKPVLNAVNALLKIITIILSPIGDLLLTLLRPILVLLKPILLTVRQLFQPFREAAAALFKQGQEAANEGRGADAAALFGLAFGTILSGVQALLIKLQAGVLKGAIDAINGILKGTVTVITGAIAFVADIFNKGAGDKIRQFGSDANGFLDGAAEQAKNAIDLAANALIIRQAQGIEKAADAVGGDIEGFADKVTAAATGGLITDADSFFNVLQGNFQQAIGNIDTFTALSGLKDNLETGINDALQDIEIDGGGFAEALKTSFRRSFLSAFGGLGIAANAFIDSRRARRSPRG